MEFNGTALSLNATEETLGECTDCQLISYYTVCSSFETCDSSENSMRIVEDVSVIVRLPCDPDAINVVSFDESTESSSTSESSSRSETYYDLPGFTTTTTGEFTPTTTSEVIWSETSYFEEDFVSTTSH